MVCRLSQSKKNLFLFFICISLIFSYSSGCFERSESVFREYEEVYIQNVDVMSTPGDKATTLTVTPYIWNDQSTDSSLLSVKVKVVDQETRLIMAEKDMDLGYLKGKSLSHNSVALEVLEPGDYNVEVQLFEEGKIVHEAATFVVIKAKPSADQPADIVLTDMNLVVTQFMNRGKDAVVDVSPGVYNQGGDSAASLTMVVTASIDPYNRYVESDELGVIKGSSRVRGNVRFVLPRKAEYTFIVTVEEKGKEVISSEVLEPVNLAKIERHITMTYPLVEEGVPPVDEDKSSTPGFRGLFTVAALLLGFFIVNRGVPNGKTHGGQGRQRGPGGR